MEEIRIRIPESLIKDRIKIERELADVVSSEEKIKLLSLFLDGIMENSNQINNDELVRLGRKIKEERFNRLEKQN